MRFGLSARFLSVFLAAFLAVGCASTRKEKRTQTIAVNTNPSGAQVWMKYDSGRKIIGTSPTEISRPYEVESKYFNPLIWLFNILPAGIMSIGAFGCLMQNVRPREERDYSTSYTILGVGGGLLLLTFVLCYLGYSESGKEVPIPGSKLSIGASKDGYLSVNQDIEIPYKYDKINFVLKKPESTYIAAVFDVNDPSRKLDKNVLVQLTINLATAFARNGKYKVIPRDQLRARLLDEKNGSYKACADESCQIETGKALAAQKSLATQLNEVGKKCVVTANLYDLKTGASEKAAMVNTGCSSEDLLDAMKQIAQQLSE